ncbi:acyl-CoA N-acyltransferase [Marasmius fiardii PR-910]|nr:acyl-CoA N-acyltransferase [Marasmius fiardii PR-910]
MSATGSKLVRLANAASRSDLQHECPQTVPSNDIEFNVLILHSTDLLEGLQARIWQIFEDNMYQLYLDSSSGWNPEDKKEELFDSLSRFIILNNGDATAAYTMFRFEYEEGFNLLYCYELQIQESYQRKGLGKFLMNTLDSIAGKWKMDEIVLTVFKANVSASRFYKALGFSVDPSSPTDEDLEELGIVDYEILSKSVPTRR